MYSEHFASPSSRNLPSFFKVLIGDFSKQLRVPPAFVKRFRGILPPRTILWNAEMGSWHVGVSKVDDSVIFQEGWSSFVRDNSLEPGDFLIFKYTGNSEFLVKMYGKNGCEKDDAVTTRKIDEPVPCIEINEEEKNMPQNKWTRVTMCHIDLAAGEIDSPSLSNVSKACQDDTVTTRKIAVPSLEKISKANKEVARTLEVANSFKSANPFFKVVMGLAYAHDSQLNVPASFFRRHMKHDSKIIMLKVSKKSWPVKLVTYSYGSGNKLYGGWPAFVKDNNVKTGDVCIFELIDRHNLVLEVSIFRCAC